MVVRYLVVFIGGIALGFFAEDIGDWATSPEPVRAFPVGGSYDPTYGIKPCSPANENELAVFAAAEASIESARNVRRGGLGIEIAAKKLLASSMLRQIGDSSKNVLVCVPADVISRLSPYLEQTLYLGHMQNFQFDLAARLINPGDEFVAELANVAFSNEPHVERHDVGYVGRDLRPKARSVLAKFGPPEEAVFVLAVEAMSAKDSLGTSAAQVAASSGDPAVLMKIAEMMTELLDDAPHTAPIEIQTRDRLYELGYALAFASEHSRPYTGPVHELMSRTVESRSMFGRLGLSPKRMCGVLNAIEGKSPTESYEFCADPEYPVAQ